MGVPLVTLAGERFVSRMGATLLHAVGHPEWIAHTAEEYVQIAQRLAADVPALNAIREGLRAETEASPLMDEAGFAEVFAGALRGMWREWCK
ncbi:O-linked N-acetylglucosamine transferase family protein, partial [Rivihabitans pingtungensis]|uniref:O-linked N-acetylglucosamine transferase family protein n=1 Tax=Rivihabitans pingtungensis TaxID=1054498 RepID=UPI0023F1F869